MGDTKFPLDAHAAVALHSLLRRLQDDHQRMEPHHEDLCPLCRDTERAIGQLAKHLPAVDLACPGCCAEPGEPHAGTCPGRDGRCPGCAAFPGEKHREYCPVGRSGSRFRLSEIGHASAYQPQQGETMEHQDQILLATATMPGDIGDTIGGGFFAGRILLGGVVYGLVVAPKAEGERTDLAWLDSEERVVGADSYSDGRANTMAMAAAGSELANWAQGLDIGGYTDWHIPSQDELEILYRNLKPTGRANYLYGRNGVNASAVPPTVAYSRDLPAQTSVPGFAEGGEQAFAGEWYWSSTQHAANDYCAWFQDFSSGIQGSNDESAELRARAVRRFVI